MSANIYTRVDGSKSFKRSVRIEADVDRDAHAYAKLKGMSYAEVFNRAAREFINRRAGGKGK